jgi:hypothetical protein
VGAGVARVWVKAQTSKSNSIAVAKRTKPIGNIAAILRIVVGGEL